MLRQATKFAPRSDAEFERTAHAGFQNAEFRLDKSLINGWEAIAERAIKYMFGYALHFPNRGDFDTRDLQDTVELYRALGCSALVIHQPMFDRYGEQLMELGHEVRLAVENHKLPTPDDFERWARDSPWLTLDVEHLWMHTAGNRSLSQLLEYVDWCLDEYGEKLAHVHLPGYHPGYGSHRPQYCSREMVLAVFTKLADVGFPGLVVSETMNEFQNQQEMQMDVLLFEHWQAAYLAAGQHAARCMA